MFGRKSRFSDIASGSLTHSTLFVLNMFVIQDDIEPTSNSICNRMPHVVTNRIWKFQKILRIVIPACLQNQIASWFALTDIETCLYIFMCSNIQVLSHVHLPQEYINIYFLYVFVCWFRAIYKFSLHSHATFCQKRNLKTRKFSKVQRALQPCYLISGFAATSVL